MKYKEGDIVSNNHVTFKIISCSIDINNYSYYEVCNINGSKFLTPFIDMKLLEDNTNFDKYYYRRKKIEKLKTTKI
jgi:hypothetical protein